MTERILEIGTGISPAIRHPGYVFSEGIDYVGTDVRSSRLDVAQPPNNPVIKDLFEKASWVVADSAALPFSDSSFTHVIMRSVFGEYTLGPDMTGSSLGNTHLGMYEAFRVLKAGGKIALAEENTPRAPSTPWQIGASLLDAGFDEVFVYPCENMKNSYWEEIRTKYWGIAQMADVFIPGGPIDQRSGFLVTANRPPSELEEFGASIVLNRVRKANRLRGLNHPGNKDDAFTAKFKMAERPVREKESQTQSFNRRNEQITIVPQDSIRISLSEYFEGQKDGSIKSYFLTGS